MACAPPTRATRVDAEPLPRRPAAPGPAAGWRRRFGARRPPARESPSSAEWRPAKSARREDSSRPSRWRARAGRRARPARLRSSTPAAFAVRRRRGYCARRDRWPRESPSRCSCGPSPVRARDTQTFRGVERHAVEALRPRKERGIAATAHVGDDARGDALGIAAARAARGQHFFLGCVRERQNAHQ